MCLFTLQTVARADDDKPIQVTQMPQPAQQFIKQHFADSKVALAKMESDFFYKSYEVIFTNGDKVEFDNKVNWEEVKKDYEVKLSNRTELKFDLKFNLIDIDF